MTVLAHPVGKNTYAVICDDCGPVSTETVESVHAACVAHLQDEHDARGVEVKLGDLGWEEA